MRAETYPVGSEIWTNDEGEMWVLAEVISQENTILTVRRKSISGERLEIDLVRREKPTPVTHTTHKRPQRERQRDRDGVTIRPW